MGLFDLPAPLFDVAHRVLAHLPPWLEIALWAVASAWAGMALYRRWSPQQRLAALRTEMAALRRELDGYDGPFAGLKSRLARLLALSLRDLVATLGPALAASVPGLLVMVWLSNAFDVQFPAPGTETPVRVALRSAASPAPLTWQPSVAATPAGEDAWRVRWPAPGETVRLADAAGATLVALPPAAPVPVLHPRSRWNLLVGNPAGYLADGGPLERVELDLPPVVVVPGAPAWLAGWVAPYVALLVVVSLLLKRRWRVH